MALFETRASRPSGGRHRPENLAAPLTVHFPKPQFITDLMGEISDGVATTADLVPMVKKNRSPSRWIALGLTGSILTSLASSGGRDGINPHEIALAEGTVSQGTFQVIPVGSGRIEVPVRTRPSQSELPLPKARELIALQTITPNVAAREKLLAAGGTAERPGIYKVVLPDNFKQLEGGAQVVLPPGRVAVDEATSGLQVTLEQPVPDEPIRMTLEAPVQGGSSVPKSVRVAVLPPS